MENPSKAYGNLLNILKEHGWQYQHTAVGSQAVRNYRTFQAGESKVLMREILEDQDDFVMSIECYSVSSTSIVAGSSNRQEE